MFSIEIMKFKNLLKYIITQKIMELLYIRVNFMVRATEDLRSPLDRLNQRQLRHQELK